MCPGKENEKEMKILRQPFNGRPYPKGFFDFVTVEGLLLLVGIEDISATVQGWNATELAEVGNWALRVHFRASDNNTVRVPPKPECVPEFATHREKSHCGNGA